MHERIKELRKTLDLTQEKFANRIGIKRNTVATYESGRNEPVDSVVSLICREFSVNEEWLRYGKGDMFKPASLDALHTLVEQYSLSDSDRILIEKFIGLKPELRKIFSNYILETAQALQEHDISVLDSSNDPSVDELEADYKKNVLNSAQKEKTVSSASSIIKDTVNKKIL